MLLPASIALTYRCFREEHGSGFERALADADLLADRMRASADRIAQRSALTHTAERARGALTRARERLANLDPAERTGTAEWP